MKKLLSFLLLAALPALAIDVQYPGSVTASSISSVGGITNGQGGVTLGLTNPVIVGGMFWPSNIYTTNLSVTTTFQNHRITTSTANGFAGLHVGDDIVFGTDQFTVSKIVSTTALDIDRVWDQSSLANVSTNIVVYPGFQLKDINGNVAGWLGNDGTHGVSGRVGGNSGQFKLVHDGNGSNNWAIYLGSDGTLLVANNSNPNTGAPLQISANAGYESIHVFGDGPVSIRSGVSNLQDTVWYSLGVMFAKQGILFGSNSWALKPATPRFNGDFFIGNSNGFVLMAQATNAAGGGAAAWTSTNYLGSTPGGGGTPLVYTGVTNIGSAATSLLISILHTMPDTNYAPDFRFVGTVSPGVGFNYSGLTTTNFTVNLSGAPGADTGARWSVIYSP